MGAEEATAVSTLFRYTFRHRQSKAIRAAEFNIEEIECLDWFDPQMEATVTNFCKWLRMMDDEGFDLVARDPIAMVRGRVRFYENDVVKWERGNRGGCLDINIGTIKYDRKAFRWTVVQSRIGEKFSLFAMADDKLSVLGSAHVDPSLLSFPLFRLGRFAKGDIVISPFFAVLTDNDGIPIKEDLVDIKYARVLSIHVSSDNGETWEEIERFSADEFPPGRYDYDIEVERADTDDHTTFYPLDWGAIEDPKEKEAIRKMIEEQKAYVEWAENQIPEF